MRGTMSANEQKLKALFAHELLKTPDEPFQAALRIEPNTGLALQMVHEWTKDAFVLEEKERLLSENGAKAFLPSKEDYARNVYKFAEEKGYDPKDRLTAYRLYGEIMGYIEKPGINIDNSKTTVTQNRVMIVNEIGSNSNWETKLLAQQKKLTDVSASC